jgi:hypothetical protein
MLEDFDHSLVLPHHVSFQLLNSLAARNTTQVLEQKSAHAPSLELVKNGEGEFSAARVVGEPHVTADADEVFVAVLGQGRNDGYMAIEIDVAKACQLSPIEPAFVAKEAQVARGFAQAVEMLEQTILIVGPQRPNKDGFSAPQRVHDRVT